MVILPSYTTKEVIGTYTQVYMEFLESVKLADASCHPDDAQS